MRYGGLIAAIVFAAIAAVVVLKLSSKPAPAPVATNQATQEVKTSDIYVAKRAIPVGTVIAADMIAPQPWPEHLVLAGFMSAKEGAKPVVGMVVRSAFQQSEPLIESKLANPNDPSFLAGDLPKGMRVVTIPINEVDGVAGFVFPGDSVDLIYTHEVDIEDSTAQEQPPSPGGLGPNAVGGGGGGDKKQTITETLLTNVKILAVDQRASNDGSTDKQGNLIIPKSASLMVTQNDAQRVRLAQKTGTVSLALRSLADKETADALVLTGPGDISQWNGETAKANGAVKVIRGAPKKQTESVMPMGMMPFAPVASGAAASADVVGQDGSDAAAGFPSILTQEAQ